MKHKDAEDLYIRSLDAPLNEHENELLAQELRTNPDLMTTVLAHAELRENLRAKEPDSFGPFFAARVVNVIEQSGLSIDRYLLSFFKKFQWAAVGVAIGLLALNVVLAEQENVMSILGLTDTSYQEDSAFVFDFFETLNENL